MAKRKPNVIKSSLNSVHLDRRVDLTLLVPDSAPIDRACRVLIMFDGQDFPAVRISMALNEYPGDGSAHSLMVVGIHAGPNRIFEYGTASQPDFAYRGNKASNTTQFVMDELIPYLKQEYSVTSDRAGWAIAGFSLGGLMALDIAWHHAEVFSRVGVFSGAFWWRKRALDDDYDESDRIMHGIVRQTRGHPPLRFWFQTGTRDEEDDRDQDGIIDSIDDTLDLIAELERKGYRWGNDIVYREVLNGEHNPKTWSAVFPEFLTWSQHST